MLDSERELAGVMRKACAKAGVLLMEKRAKVDSAKGRDNTVARVSIGQRKPIRDDSC